MPLFENALDVGNGCFDSTDEPATKTILLIFEIFGGSAKLGQRFRVKLNPHLVMA